MVDQKHTEHEFERHAVACTLQMLVGIVPASRKENMNKPSEQIEDAQHKLHDAILAALSAFSEETGLTVPSASWTTTRAMDANGHTKEVKYHSVRTDLASGAW